MNILKYIRLLNYQHNWEQYLNIAIYINSKISTIYMHKVFMVIMFID